MVYSTPSEDDRVYVRVRFGGGYNALPADRPSAAWAGEVAMVESGIGKLKQGDIEQLTAGRRIGLSFDIGDDAFVYSSMTSPKDLTNQLRLMAAKMAAPGWDPNPVARAKSLVLAGYAGYDASPTGVLTRDMEGLLHDGDPRWATPSRDQVNATTPASFRALWEPLLDQGPIEVQVFGDIDADAAIKAVAASIGALPPRTAPKIVAPPVRFPAHNASPLILTHGGPDSQAAAVIVWPTGGGTELESDSNYLDVLAAVFSDRLFDRLRSEAGASYSPSVQSQWPVGMSAGGRLFAIGQVAPQNVDLFFRMSREIAADLVAHPIGEDELQRTVAPMKQLILRQATGNSFWLNQLQNGTYDPGRIQAMRDMFREIGNVTAPQIQAVAERYLRPDKDWTMAVMPRDKDGKAVAIVPAAAVAKPVVVVPVKAAPVRQPRRKTDGR